MRPQYILYIFVISLLGCTPLPPVPPSTSTQNAAPTSIAYQASTQSDIDLELYIDPAGRYTIKYPKTWLVAPSDIEGPEVFFVEASEDGELIQSYFAVITESTVVDLSTHGRYALTSLQSLEEVSEFMLVSEQDINVNGVQGLQHIMTYVTKERPLAQRSILLQEHNHTYAISMLVLQDQFEEYGPIFDAVLQSFQTE